MFGVQYDPSASDSTAPQTLHVFECSQTLLSTSGSTVPNSNTMPLSAIEGNRTLKPLLSPELIQTHVTLPYMQGFCQTVVEVSLEPLNQPKHMPHYSVCIGSSRFEAFEPPRTHVKRSSWLDSLSQTVVRAGSMQ